MKFHPRILVLAAAVLCIGAPASGEEDPLADAMAVLTEKLTLNDEQQTEVAGHLREFAIAMDAATAPAEDEAAEGAEGGPSPLALVKAARADFADKMEQTLTKEQWQTFETGIDAMLEEMFEDLAGIVIVDLVPLLGLTDEQALALEPVLGSAMRGILGVAIEFSDAKMNKRTKVKVGKAVKGIKGDLDSGLAEVLTPEQIEAYQAYKEASKAAAE